MYHNQIRMMGFIALWSLLFGCESDPNQPEITKDITFSVSDFTTPDKCGECHPDHYAEWRSSMHAYAIQDPVFIRINSIGQSETNGGLDQFCVKCHSPIGSRGGETKPFFNQADLSPISMSGVTCDFCHSITTVTGSGRADFDFSPSEIKRGPLGDAIPNPFHQSQGDPMFDRSEFCGACHDVINDQNVLIEKTNIEWNESQYASMIRSCQDCHMQSYDEPKQIAVGGPERENVHSHYFVGVDLAVTDFPDVDLQRTMVQEMLESAADITLSGEDTVSPGDIYELRVSVLNKGAGHNLPTGPISDRQMWLEIIVTDAAGNGVYTSGLLDANGDLMDHHSALNPGEDPDLMNFNGTMLGDNGEEVHFFWQARSVVDRSIPALTAKEQTYLIQVSENLTGNLSISVRLLFRAFPPYLLRLIELESLIGKYEIFKMAEAIKTVIIK